MLKQAISELMIKRNRDLEFQPPPHNKNATFDWIQWNSGLPWLELDIPVPADAILKEIVKIESYLTVHREDYSEHAGWKSFCIHGKAFDATREDTHYNDQRPYTWTDEALQHMPETVEFFKNTWPGSGYRRIRVMLLEPGGYITIHADATSPGMRAVNISITQPDQCDFIMAGHGIVPYQVGSAMWLDTSNLHVVYNHSTQPRWHIIVHQQFDNIKFQDLVVNSYKMLYNSINAPR